MQDYKNYIEKKHDLIYDIVKRMDYEKASAEELTSLIDALEKELGRNPYIAMSKALLFERQGEIQKSIDVLEENLKRYPFHYFSHYYLMMTYMEKIDVDKAFYYYAYALRYHENEEDIADLAAHIQGFKRMLRKTKNQYYKENKDKLEEMLERVTNEKDYTIFPFDINGESLIRKNMYPDRTDDTYFMNLYKTHNNFAEKWTEKIQLLQRYEVFKGDMVEDVTEIDNNRKDMIAVSAINKDINFKAETKDGAVLLERNLYHKNFHYFKFPQDGKLKLSANSPFFMSHLKHRVVPDRPKLVMYIFVDGLAFKFLKENNFEKTMPNLHRFFSQGHIADNCFATAEWTQPTLTTIATGKYTEEHSTVNADWNYNFEQYHKMMQDYFYEQGYMTARICNNWRLTPSFGYFKNAERFLYAPMRERMHCEEVVMEVMEHLEVFKEFSNFLWVTIEDLHVAGDAIDNNPLVSRYEDKVVSNGWEDRTIVSVFREYNEDGINYYLAELKKIDFYLGMLFDYIEENYTNDEILIALGSDHGQFFLSPSREFFKEDRTNVAFMLRGRGIEPCVSEELCSNVDVMPTLLHLCDIPLTEPIDGCVMHDFGGPARKFTYTEAIYKNQPYYATINDGRHVFHFISKGRTKPDGGICLFEYVARLFDRATGENITKKFPDECEYYKAIVYEHAKTWIYI